MTALSKDELISGIDSSGNPVHTIVGNTTGALLQLRQQGSGNALEIVDGNGVKTAISASGLVIGGTDVLTTALGLKGFNFTPWASDANAAAVSQTLYGIVVPTQAGVTYTGLKLITAVAGVGTVPTGFFVGLASAANLGSTGTMLTQSGNLNGSASLTTGGAQSFPFSAPYTETVSGIRMALVLKNGAFGTTDVTFGKRSGLSSFGGTAGLNLTATAGLAVTAFNANGQALSATYANSSTQPFWVGLY